MRHGRELTSLGWGFAVCVLLVLVTSVASLSEVSRVRGELLELVTRSERSGYLIGDIGQRLSQMRLLLREAAAVDQAPAPDLPVMARMLTASVEELGPLLERNEIQLWGSLGPEILELRDELLEAQAALAQGQTVRANGLLDKLVAEQSDIMTDLALLSLLERESTDEALLDADDYLQKLKLAEVVVSSLLMLGISVTWLVVIRLVQRQREQLNQDVARVQRANEDLNAFAGRIAHDLRDVLSPLLLIVASLKRDDAAGASAASERIAKVTSRALGLLDALLSFSRAGERSGSNESCSVLVELRAVLEELLPTAERVDARIELEPGSEDARVRCSAGLFGIVVRNIVSNALKALDGRKTRTVRIAVSAPELGYCRITVTDTGPGIPDDALARIFEPFYRVPGTQTRGTGIGLATVQRVLRAHDGDVTVRSKLGEGTRFEVKLPLERPPARPSATEGPSLAL